MIDIKELIEAPLNFLCTAIISTPAFAGASPYSMGGASQGTPTPMMSPAPPGGPQDMAGYGMGINGSDYGSQPYNDGSMGYDPMHQVIIYNHLFNTLSAAPILQDFPAIR
ncbi:hypothetical protein M0802_014438 [Mischocyttarus mexicanus]|nr:hypothetical protein M0802_014439 [Mischocyttarus mexicanus]KAI4479242.1 hypothetical protein M0802_014438 [Mischocyttarus mexicanus]